MLRAQSLKCALILEFSHFDNIVSSSLGVFSRIGFSMMNGIPIQLTSQKMSQV